MLDCNDELVGTWMGEDTSGWIAASAVSGWVNGLMEGTWVAGSADGWLAE